MSDPVNNCQFIGNLGKDVDFNVTPNTQTSVAKFTVAATTKRGGNERTYWVNVKAFGKLAELCRDYLHKGKQVAICGQMAQETWERDGRTHYKDYLYLDGLKMLGSRDDRGSGSPPQQSAPQAQSGGKDFEDDIPF